MASALSMLLLLCISVVFLGLCSAEDPFAFYDFEVSYITASPLGVEQQVCTPDLSFTSCPFAQLVPFVCICACTAAFSNGLVSRFLLLECWVLDL